MMKTISRKWARKLIIDGVVTPHSVYKHANAHHFFMVIMRKNGTLETFEMKAGDMVLWHQKLAQIEKDPKQ